MTSRGSLIRAGDHIWVDDEVCQVTSVGGSDDRDGYVRVELEGKKRARHVPVSRVREVLVAREEDLRSMQILELRVMEAGLLAKIRMLDRLSDSGLEIKGDEDVELELRRALYAVRYRLRVKDARPGHSGDAFAIEVEELR